jgi:hypothetical protein
VSAGWKSLHEVILPLGLHVDLFQPIFHKRPRYNTLQPNSSHLHITPPLGEPIHPPRRFSRSRSGIACHKFDLIGSYGIPTAKGVDRGITEGSSIVNRHQKTLSPVGRVYGFCRLQYNHIKTSWK